MVLGMETKEIRRQNMLDLLKTMRQKDARAGHRTLAEKTGCATNYISQVKQRTRNMGDKVARRFERSFGLPRGWMDTLNHPRTTAAEVSGTYDLVSAAESEQAIEKFNSLHPAFREYIVMKMGELQRYADSLPEFLRRNLQAPNADTYYDWERDMAADMARLQIRDEAAVPGQSEVE